MDDLQTPTDPVVQTPLLEMLEASETRSYGFWAVEKIQYTRNDPYYYVDILFLSTEEQHIEALDILKTAVNRNRCCFHDEQYWAQHMTGFARIYYYRLEEWSAYPDYLYALYEG